MMRSTWFTVLILAMVALGPATADDERVFVSKLPSLGNPLEMNGGLKVTQWSTRETDGDVGLTYRIGLLTNEATVDLSPHGMSVLLEVNNIGKVTQYLSAHGGNTLVCSAYVEGKMVGYCPVVAKAIPGPIVLSPGESWIEVLWLGGYWEPPEPGKKHLVIGFRVRQDRNKDNTVTEVKSSPVVVKFKKRNSSNLKQNTSSQQKASEER